MISLVLHVVPKSGKQSIQLDKAQRIKVHLKSQPEKGAANQELIKFIADLLKIPLKAVQIVSGATSRTKRIKIDTQHTMAEIFKKLNLEVQHALI